MMSVVEFFSQPVWHRLSLTLVHFLWQGLVVAVVACAAVRLLRLKRGNPRYGAYLLAFAVMAVCPPATFTVLATHAAPAVIAPGPMPEIESSGPVPRSVVYEPRRQPSEDTLPIGLMRRISLQERLDAALQTSLPWMLVCWMGGVLVLSVRLLLGFIGVRRWRRNLEPLAEGLQARVALLTERLGMPGFSRVFLSGRAMEAVAMGYLRPTVLLPAAMVTHMPPEMLEAVIAHELAHIRRFDLWVNLAQRVVETLLFYHPAVWWLSNRVRAEREICCDELAVKATGERLTYASALESAGRVRLAMGRPAFAAGFGQGQRPMLSRVVHILGLPPTPPDSRAWLAGVIAVTLLAILAIPAVSALTAGAEDRSAAKNAVDVGESGQPRFAARTFNSEMAFDVLVQPTPHSGLLEMRSDSGLKRIGATPSAAPLEIPACWIWWVQASASVQDWDLLAREISQKQVPGLVLWSVTDAGLRHLAGLVGLRLLAVKGPEVSDEGVAQLKALTQLETLALDGTRVTDAGLAHLTGMTTLEELFLRDNAITDAGLARLEGLTGLRELQLKQDSITDAGMAHLKGMADLESLDLSGTQITDVGMEHLKDLAGLQRLLLHGCPITDAGLAHLKGMADLKCLSLSGTQITDVGMEHLKALTGLVQLYLPNTQITDAGLTHLEGMTKLRMLFLEDTQIRGPGLAHLKAQTGLVELYLSNTQITDAGLTHLEGLRDLQFLSLDHTQVTDAGLEHLRGLAGLRLLSLQGRPITDTGLEHLKSLTELRWLEFSEAPITDAGLAHLQGMTNLQWLRLVNAKITGPGLEYLKGLSRLRSLDLQSNPMTDAGLTNIEGLTGLEKLWLGNTPITDSGMENLKGLTRLSKLDLDLHGTRITDAAKERLKQSHPNLVIMSE